MGGLGGRRSELSLIKFLFFLPAFVTQFLIFWRAQDGGDTVGFIPVSLFLKKEEGKGYNWEESQRYFGGEVRNRSRYTK